MRHFFYGGRKDGAETPPTKCVTHIHIATDPAKEEEFLQETDCTLLKEMSEAWYHIIIVDGDTNEARHHFVEENYMNRLERVLNKEK